MKQFKTTLWTLLGLLLVFGCQRDEQEAVPDMPQRGTRMVSADDIPLVMTSLSERLNFREGDTQTANTGQVQTGLGVIDLEQIFEVIDTLDNANYTFLVDDEDGDIFTFTNLVVKKREDGSIDPPYLLRYTVDSLHRDEFLQSGLSMEHFTGMISKRFLTNFSSQQESSANLGGEYDANTTEPCDYDSRATGGGGEIGWTDPIPPDDGGSTGGGFIRCEFVTLAEEVTTCYRSDIGDGPRCTTVTQYVTKTHCYWVGPSQEVYDGTNCPDPETEEVGVMTGKDDGLLMQFMMTQIKNMTSKENIERMLTLFGRYYSEEVKCEILGVAGMLNMMVEASDPEDLIIYARAYIDWFLEVQRILNEAVQDHGSLSSDDVIKVLKGPYYDYLEESFMGIVELGKNALEGDCYAEGQFNALLIMAVVGNKVAITKPVNAPKKFTAPMRSLFETHVSKIGRNVKVVDRAKINADIEASGGYAPWGEGMPMVEANLKGQGPYVRFFKEGESFPTGRWLTLRSEVEGLTPQQIQKKLALSYIPDKMVTYTNTTNPRVYMGEVAPVSRFNAEGKGFQIQLLEQVPNTDFSIPMEIRW
jgi:hypothetical protein